MMLEILALALALIHFGFPLAYYCYAKNRWFKKPWNLKLDAGYRPKVTVILPTYNEAKLIVDRLNNIYIQDYPKDLVEVIVVDSASDDGTPELVEKWASEHGNLNLKLLLEPKRRGMVPALNYALQCCKPAGEITIFTDVDAIWDSNALTNIVRYFADPEVGAVTASVIPESQLNDSLEGGYRNFYNLLRVAESKISSTPVHNGVLIAFRTRLIYMIGGLPSYTGNNDSTPASIIAFMGYRAIQVDDVIVREPVRREQLRRKIRRAQHLILSFLKTGEYVKRMGLRRSSKLFERIWKIEWWLHIVNPWLLLFSALVTWIDMIHGGFISLAFLVIGLLLLLFKPYRVWIMQQLYLIIAAIRNLWTKEIIWSK